MLLFTSLLVPPPLHRPNLRAPRLVESAQSLDNIGPRLAELSHIDRHRATQAKHRPQHIPMLSDAGPESSRCGNLSTGWVSTPFAGLVPKVCVFAYRRHLHQPDRLGTSNCDSAVSDVAGGTGFCPDRGYVADAGQQLESFEGWVLRHMLDVDRPPDEEWPPFSSCQRAADRLRRAVDMPPLLDRAVRAVHALLCHVARRIGIVAQVVLGWRDALWWSIVQHVGAAGRVDPWRHPARN